MFAIFLQLTAFNFIFLDAVKFELRLSEIVGKIYGKNDIHVTQPSRPIFIDHRPLIRTRGQKYV